MVAMSPLPDTPTHFYRKQKMFFDESSISITFTFQGHERCSFKAARRVKIEVFLQLQHFQVSILRN